MHYFESRENVDLYTGMMAEYDNGFIINEVQKVLPCGASLLELGMGTGVDLISLSKHYCVTGSDSSRLFVDDFKKKSDLNVLVLDAVTLDIEGRFDCIYSNKVLQHLKREDFVASLSKQCAHLTERGIIFATLWAGEHREEFEFQGQLRFVYYDKGSLETIIPSELKIDSLFYYTEFEKDDSLVLILRRKEVAACR